MLSLYPLIPFDKRMRTNVFSNLHSINVFAYYATYADSKIGRDLITYVIY